MHLHDANSAHILAVTQPLCHKPDYYSVPPTISLQFCGTAQHTHLNIGKVNLTDASCSSWLQQGCDSRTRQYVSQD